MTEIQQLNDECHKFYRCKSVDDSLELIDIYAEYLFLTIKNRRKKANESKDEFEARMIFQMMLTKTLHLKSVIKGISYKAKDGGTLNEIIDPTIVASLIRNIYETVGMFNLIYRTPKSTDEKTILYNLWVHAGLSYRQRFASIATTEENKAKLEYDQEHLAQLVTEIENTDLYKQLEPKNQGKIKTRLKEKEYLMIFNDKDVRFLAWHDLAEIMGVREGLMDGIYTYFSLYSHPSNVSVFQFADMFKKGNEAFPQLTNFNLKYFFTLTSIFIADYIKVFPEAKETFDTLPIRDQIVINFHNTFIRSKDFSINDSWKALELKV